MEKLLFSIIIPTYNRRDYIGEAVDSVLAQDYPHFEVIIVDDGSNDDTGVFIQAKYGSESKVRYFFKQNEERGAARNFGLRKAAGSYVVFFDSDDWMKANYLQILHTVIKTNAYPHFVAAKYSFRDGNGREWPSSMTSIKAGWYGLDTFVKGNMLACNVCVKNANPHLQLFPEERELASMEDWLFLLRNLQTQKIYISDQVGVVMREHEGRSMANNQKIIAARQKATQWALQHLTLNCRHRKLVQAYSAYFCGIHEYIEGNRFASLRNSIKAFQAGGMQPLFFILFLKSLIGKNIIYRFQNYAG